MNGGGYHAPAMPLLGRHLDRNRCAAPRRAPAGNWRFGDVEGARKLEPGRPLRLLDAHGETRALGVADPENELLRVWSHGEGARAPDAAFVRAQARGGAGLAADAGPGRRRVGLPPVQRRGGRPVGPGGRRLRLVRGRDALSRGLVGHARLLAEAALELLPAAGLPLAGVVLKARLKGPATRPSAPRTTSSARRRPRS